MVSTVKLQQAIEEFLNACHADGLRPPTVKWYQQKLSMFRAATTAESLEQIRLADMRAYISGLYNRDHRLVGDANNKRKQAGKLSIATMRGHIRMLRRFWAWSVKEYRLKTNPMDGIQMPREGQAGPKAISNSDARKLLLACEDGTVIGLRNKAMIAFLLDTGCRAGGLLGLQPHNLNLVDRRAQLVEKGNKARLVGFSEYTAQAIAAWMEARPTNTEFVFCSLGSKPWGRLTGAGLHRMLSETAQKAGISGRYNAHSFRHAFARRYIRAGGDVSTLTKLMGHSSSAITTQVYAVFMVEEALQAYEKIDLMGRLLSEEE